jgi:conjugative transfer region lipoprotein (TIGR03751 family)
MGRRCPNAMPALLLMLAALGGCATNKEALLTHTDATMLDIWNQHTGGEPRNRQANRQLLDARQALRRPLVEMSDAATALSAHAAYTRTARNEIHHQFHRLPNPDLVMYVFPHLVGTEQVPVPGYSTVFPLHQRIEYALPGERTETY